MESVLREYHGALGALVVEYEGTVDRFAGDGILALFGAPTAHEDAYNGPDGLKLGPDGNYYIAQNGSGRVLVVNDDGKLVRLITVPTPYVTNMNFGADGADTLYITGVFDPWKAPFPGAVYRWKK